MAAAVPACLLGLGLTWGLVLPRLDALWLSPRIAHAVAAHARCPNPTLAAAGYTEPSLVFLAGTGTVLGGGAEAADRLAADPGCALALVAEGGDRQAFEARAAERGLAPRQVARLDGFNYSRGKAVSLGLYDAGGTP
jgi:hypothetical protein